MASKEVVNDAPKELFTKIYDYLLWKYGDLSLAIVYGKVERFAMGSSGYCYASHETIAEQLSMSRKTVLGKIHKLVLEGYLIDLDEKKRNNPHTYLTSGMLNDEYEEFVNFIERVRDRKDEIIGRVKNGEAKLVELLSNDFHDLYQCYIHFGDYQL